MPRKPLNGNGDSNRLGATGISMGGFPLGSPKSRAAARALLVSKNTLSQDDEDALLLHGCILGTNTEPDYTDLGVTAAYKRGKELYDSRHGPVIPAHLDKRYQRSTRASLEFEWAFGREPNAGDVLSYEHVLITRGPAALKAFYGPIIEAWHRQIPELMCPYKFESDRLFRHLRMGGWHEAIDKGPQENWFAVEQHVMGNAWRPPSSRNIPTIPAIVFLGVIDGEHKCRPAE